MVFIEEFKVKRPENIVAYQGGKGNIAKTIVDNMEIDFDLPFYDICCGTGAISIELVSRGFPKEELIMIDAGPWGLFWEKIGDGTFNLNVFKQYIDSIPKDLYKVKDFMKELANQPADIDTAEVFILLQAGSFGGKAIYIKNNQWINSSFRDYWKSTATSNRRSTVKPMVEPSRLVKRVEETMEYMNGVIGIHNKIENLQISTPSILYIDPPYLATTKYGHNLDYMSFVKLYQGKSKIYVSEGKPLNNDAVQIQKVRPKGGISGKRKSPHEEWLSCF